MASPETQKLAGGEFATLFASIERINHRLAKLEARAEDLKLEISNSRSSDEVSSLRSDDPSLDRFNVAEAIADSIFSDYRKEKACQFEPGKPCDHCSMCNSRGF